MQNKFEGIVFAKDSDRVKELINDLFSGYPVKMQEPINIAGGTTKKSLQEIYNERPELIGISPDEGYICNMLQHKNKLERYFK